jgi:hypothetical protein
MLVLEVVVEPLCMVPVLDVVGELLVGLVLVCANDGTATNVAMAAAVPSCISFVLMRPPACQAVRRHRLADWNAAPE